jgi:arginine/serine-rich splicing factor 4/5/6
MLFEPFGELVRIDMKRNYAFVQFRNIEEATRAKEVTNGGKLDQSVLTVEYVARQRRDGERGGPDRRGGRDGGDRGGDRGDRGGGGRRMERGGGGGGLGRGNGT